MPDVLEAPARERTADDQAEVDALLAMLEGEPSCDLTDVTEWTSTQCFRPARWIGRLHCGHPVVFCDFHHRGIVHEPYGAVRCSCGEFSSWYEGHPVGQIGYSTALRREIRVTGPKPNMWPL